MEVSSRYSNEAAIENFREYLRIKSVHPTPDYNGCVKFFKKMAEQMKLKYKIVQYKPNYPVFLMTWEGKNLALPSLLLNSHMDVVPVFPEHWKYDPFSATMDEKGDIYARGSQDMKCVGMQYIEAIRKLKEAGTRLERTVHLSFVPDEEKGGFNGMNLLVQSDDFRSLNIGFVLDEGLASPTEEFMVYYSERRHWTVEVTCPGNPGHSSAFIENTACEKLRRIMNSALDFRCSEETRLKSDPTLSLGDVFTTNVTIINGGVQANVVPSEFVATIDLRIPPSWDSAEVEKTIERWCSNAGSDVTYKMCLVALLSLDRDRQNSPDSAKSRCSLQKFKGVSVVQDKRYKQADVTSTSPEDPWWKAFCKPFTDMKLKTKPAVFPAATDSSYLRQLGYPAIGFSPMNNTPVLLHDHNEYLNASVFLKGINIYAQLITSLANVP